MEVFRLRCEVYLKLMYENETRETCGRKENEAMMAIFERIEGSE